MSASPNLDTIIKDLQHEQTTQFIVGIHSCRPTGESWRGSERNPPGTNVVLYAAESTFRFQKMYIRMLVDDTETPKSMSVTVPRRSDMTLRSPDAARLPIGTNMFPHRLPKAYSADRRSRNMVIPARNIEPSDGLEFQHFYFDAN